MMMLIILLIFMFIMINLMKKLKLLLLIMKIYTITIFCFMFMWLMSPNLFTKWSNIYYIISMDSFSWSLNLLTLWIYLMMLMTSYQMKNKQIYFNIMNCMLLSLILCFSSMNLISFYIYFEISLIPMLMLIMGWGKQIERIQASFYMMLYTLFGSMPLLFIIIYLYNMNLSMMMMLLKFNSSNFLMYLSLTLAFFIKMPMYMTHAWLPLAHVEAPIMGSMILAGIMLKLGSYGMLRIMMISSPLTLKFNKYFIVISLMGGLISSFICLMQIDMKMLVAYSSVVHMSLMMSSMLTMFNMSLMGSLMMMIAHGLCSSALFMLVNINYERIKSRSLFINKGMINYFPSLSLMWFLLSSSNLAFPPSLNFFSEIFLLNSLLMWNKLIILILMNLSFFSASYTIYLFSFSQFGKFNLLNMSLSMINMNEFMTLLFHWIPLNLMFLMMTIL